jgi:hypothetical protein
MNTILSTKCVRCFLLMYAVNRSELKPVKHIFHTHNGFHVQPCSGSRVDRHGQTDGRPDTTDRSCVFRDNATYPTNQTQTETSNIKT